MRPVRRLLQLKLRSIQPHALIAPRIAASEAAPSHVLRAVTVTLSQQRRANVRHHYAGFSELWFNSSLPRDAPEGFNGNGGKDQRIVNLGKTVQILHDRLPDLLASPLPQDILSPTISLHLFPSTHPHLPTVSGRIAYTAALWTAPVAWGRLPVVGNVRLIILSERMVNSAHNHIAPYTSPEKEKLIVRWKTCGKTKGLGVGSLYKGISGHEPQGVDKITEFLGGSERDDRKEFSGLFTFEFDEQGRICKHVIEHAQENGDQDRMNRVVDVTDWLLGKARGREVRRRTDGGIPELAFCVNERRGHERKSGRWR